MEQQQQQVQYPLAVTHLLQQTLRSLCIHRNSQWVYAVFWRILPRNYPPPKWDLPGSFYDRSRGNRRNWILVWEDGFCNFAASCEGQHTRGLRPELFFKMSHEIYNYGEGSIGKVASDNTHKWVSKEPAQERGINFLSSWHNTAESHPRIWEAQFQSGIKTIALIAVKEGVVQLGAVNKVVEDLSHVVLLRKRFSYLESIPGVLLPHPTSSAFPFKIDYAAAAAASWCNDEQAALDNWTTQTHPNLQPSMSSLEALLSKLPPVGPSTPTPLSSPSGITSFYHSARRRSSEMDHNLVVAKEEMEEGKQYDGRYTLQIDRSRSGGS